MIQSVRSTIGDDVHGTLTWHMVCYYYCCCCCCYYYYIARHHHHHHHHHPARQTQGAMASSSNLYRGAYFKERIMSPNVPITQLQRGQSYFTYYPPCHAPTPTNANACRDCFILMQIPDITLPHVRGLLKGNVPPKLRTEADE